MIVSINRLEAFNPDTLFGSGYSILKQNEKSLALKEIDTEKIFCESAIRNTNKIGTIENEQKTTRLKELGYICLDAQIFETFWNNQNLIPEQLKISSGVLFDGTIMQYGDTTCTLCLFWKDNKWNYTQYWLMERWHALIPSAVIKEDNKKWYHFFKKKR